MGDLERDTRLQPEAADADSKRFRVALSSDWEIWGPNGGYLAVIALRAAGCVARIPRPVSYSGHFLSVARFDEVELVVTPLRLGRRSESLRVSMQQAGKPVLEAIVRTAAEGPGLVHEFGERPSAPGPDGLRAWDELSNDGPGYPFWQNLEARPTTVPDLTGPRQPRDPAILEWYRFRPTPCFEDPFVDAGRSLLLLDTMSWPAACGPHVNEPFTAPNLDVTAWFHRSAPDSEWLLVDHRSPTAGAGTMGTQGEVWSQDGRLVATGGAQLLCVPTPPQGAS
ncbi:MAG: thioesterase family protein [Proteobacteria bacterium]|nr:thioesterase family protein [Pseudomonadota bacterium]